MSLMIGIWALGAITAYKAIPAIFASVDEANRPKKRKREFYWWWTDEPCFTAVRGTEAYDELMKKKRKKMKASVRK